MIRRILALLALAMTTAWGGVGADTTFWRDSLQRRVDAWVSEGFLEARAQAWVDAGQDSALVSTHRGLRSVWGDLRASGSPWTPATLQRLARWRTGEPANPADLELVRQRLSAGGRASVVSMRLVAVPNTRAVDGVLVLEAKPSSQIEGAAGWDPQRGWDGFLKADLGNLLGTERDLSFSWSAAGDMRAASLRYKEPWIGPLDLQGLASAQIREDSLSAFWEIRAGAARAGSGGLDVLSVEAARALRIERGAVDSVVVDREEESSVRLGWTWRSQPASPWPWSGQEMQISMDAVDLKTLDKNRQRARLRFSAESRFPLGLAVGVRTRLLWPLNSSVPLAEAAPPGGLDGWRGWRVDQPYSPHWIYGTLETRWGQPDASGAFLFGQPGLWWRRNSSRTWDPVAAWSAGLGGRVANGSTQLRLLLAWNSDTRTWDQALLQAQITNRF